jgi:hypothetical protein
VGTSRTPEIGMLAGGLFVGRSASAGGWRAGQTAAKALADLDLLLRVACIDLAASVQPQPKAKMERSSSIPTRTPLSKVGASLQ